MATFHDPSEVNTAKRNLQIIMTTCTRPTGASYIAETLAQIAREHPEPAVQVINDTENRGNVGSFGHALRFVQPGHHVLWLQDDLRLCKNAVNAMSRCPVPDGCPCVTFCDGHHFQRTVPWRFVDGVPAASFYKIPLPLALYSLSAVLFAPHAIEILSATWPISPLRDIGDKADHTVSHLLTKAYGEFAVCIPNLVQHAGHISSTFRRKKIYDNRHNHAMYSVNYVGDDFDAGALLF